MSDAALVAAVRAWDQERTAQAAAQFVHAWARSGLPMNPPSVVPPYEARVLAWLSQGGRDPRIDPRPNDVVAARQRKYANKDGTTRNGYRPRTWTVLPPPPPEWAAARRWPIDSPYAGGFTYSDLFTNKVPNSHRLVRRARVGADGQDITEAIAYRSWRRFCESAVVVHIACCGRGALDECASCLGTGFPIFNTGETADAEAPQEAAKTA